MFIKTKEEIWELVKCKSRQMILDGENHIVYKNDEKDIGFLDTDIISQSENIEDLFDEVVFENKGYVIVGSRRSLKKSVFEEMETQDFKIYGAIWVDTNTKPTLKSVARYENGEWVLL